jgi:hypothetical protein
MLNRALAKPTTWSTTPGYPNSDLTVGDYSPSTGSTLWECLDEEPYSDTDYVYADVIGDADEKFKVGIGWCYGTGTATLRVRIRVDVYSETSYLDCYVVLWEGASNRGSDTFYEIGEAWTEQTVSCSGIVDYNALSVEVDFQRASGSETIEGRCSWIKVDSS